MIKFNLLKINNPNNSLKELLTKYCDNVIYLTRDDLYSYCSNKAILDVNLRDFKNFSTYSELLYKYHMIIFDDNDWCYIFKNRSGKLGLYRTEELKIDLINGIYY